MKAKPVIFIISTLLIGFVLGMLTSAQLRIHKLKPVRVYFSEERFREGFYKIIQPDEQQKVVIEKVLDKYAKEMSDLQTDFRRNFDSRMKAFRKELDSKLTKEQVARLREMDEKRQEMIREGRRNRQNDSINRRYDGRDGEDRQREGPSRFERHDSTSHDSIGNE